MKKWIGVVKQTVDMYSKAKKGREEAKIVFDKIRVKRKFAVLVQKCFLQIKGADGSSSGSTLDLFKKSYLTIFLDRSIYLKELYAHFDIEWTFFTDYFFYNLDDKNKQIILFTHFIYLVWNFLTLCERQVLLLCRKIFPESSRVQGKKTVVILSKQQVGTLVKMLYMKKEASIVPASSHIPEDILQKVDDFSSLLFIKDPSSKLKISSCSCLRIAERVQSTCSCVILKNYAVIFAPIISAKKRIQINLGLSDSSLQELQKTRLKNFGEGKEVEHIVQTSVGRSSRRLTLTLPRFSFKGSNIKRQRLVDFHSEVEVFSQSEYEERLQELREEQQRRKTMLSCITNLEQQVFPVDFPSFVAVDVEGFLEDELLKMFSDEHNYKNLSKTSGNFLTRTFFGHLPKRISASSISSNVDLDEGLNEPYDYRKEHFNLFSSYTVQREEVFQVFSMVYNEYKLKMKEVEEYISQLLEKNEEKDGKYYKLVRDTAKLKCTMISQGNSVVEILENMLSEYEKKMFQRLNKVTQLRAKRFLASDEGKKFIAEEIKRVEVKDGSAAYANKKEQREALVQQLEAKFISRKLLPVNKSIGKHFEERKCCLDKETIIFRNSYGIPTKDMEDMLTYQFVLCEDRSYQCAKIINSKVEFKELNLFNLKNRCQKENCPENRRRLSSIKTAGDAQGQVFMQLLFCPVCTAEYCHECDFLVHSITPTKHEVIVISKEQKFARAKIAKFISTLKSADLRKEAERILCSPCTDEVEIERRKLI
eukprot:snap_masked-scaffold_39-processed-gene-1.18-mRNA-1 protein AED:1.00 eAED:1.00 QI:0/0/0/0/1/1/2/0/760